MRHEELRELIPIYALDALPPSEQAELEVHLRSCRACALALLEHRETAGMLGLWAGDQPAPPALKARIMGQAGRMPQWSSPVVPMAGNRRIGARSWRAMGAVAALVAILTAGGVAGDKLSEQSRRVQEQSQLLARQRRALDLASAADSIVIPMTPARSPGRARGRVFISDDDGAAAVFMSGLEPPKGKEVYTLWLMSGGGRVPVKDFRPDAGRAVVTVEQPVPSNATLAVTKEPAPGNSRPKGPVVSTAYRA